MMVVAEYLVDAGGAHRFHRCAIDQAVALVGPALVKTEPLEEGSAGLRKDRDVGFDMIACTILTA